MASSVSGQYEPNLHCYWIPEWAIWTKSYTVIGDPSGQDGATCPLGITRSIPQEKFPQSHIIYPLLSKLVWSRWLYVGLVLFFACWWTSTSSRSIIMQKKNLANIQPSWPHTGSITHTYSQVFTLTLSFLLDYPRRHWWIWSMAEKMVRVTRCYNLILEIPGRWEH